MYAIFSLYLYTCTHCLSCCFSLVCFYTLIDVLFLYFGSSEENCDVCSLTPHNKLPKKAIELESGSSTAANVILGQHARVLEASVRSHFPVCFRPPWPCNAGAERSLAINIVSSSSEQEDFHAMSSSRSALSEMTLRENLRLFFEQTEGECFEPDYAVSRFQALSRPAEDT